VIKILSSRGTRKEMNPKAPHLAVLSRIIIRVYSAIFPLSDSLCEIGGVMHERRQCGRLQLHSLSSYL
jgi:hypothetical protein